MNKSQLKALVKEIINEMLQEDWKFEPTKAGGLLPDVKPNYDLTNLKRDDTDALPDYHQTKDAGTKKTDKMTKKYYRRNQTNAVNQVHLDLPNRQMSG